MLKNISVRGRKDIVAVFKTYKQISVDKQETSRAKAMEDFIYYVGNMEKNIETVKILKMAAKKSIDVSTISEQSVPQNIKIPIEVKEEIWQDAMDVFRYVFGLKKNPQIAYFIKVAGKAYIDYIEKQCMVKKQIIENITIDEFEALNIDNKLKEIYRLLIERK